MCHWADIARTCPNTCQSCHVDFNFGDVFVTSPLMDGTVRYYGNTFELRALRDITLVSFDVHLFGSSTVVVEVWIRSISGEQTGDWEPMCSSSVVSRGRYETVPIPVADCMPLEISEGSVFEIYVTIESSKDLIMVPDSNWKVETEDLRLSNGAAVAHFDAKRVGGYGFDGSVRYSRTCKDKGSTVYISDWAGDRSCAWLGRNLDRMAFACEFADVAAHCPATCSRC